MTDRLTDRTATDRVAADRTATDRRTDGVTDRTDPTEAYPATGRLLDGRVLVEHAGGVDPSSLPAVPPTLPQPVVEPVTAPAQVAPVGPPTVVPDVVVQVACPTCGTRASVNTTRRDADDFCVTCDHPLFWAVERSPVVALDASDTSLRRLPGTAGRATLAFVDCRACDEPNAPSNTHCGRCGTVLAAPVEVAAPPPPPPEVVEVVRVAERDWTLVWLSVIAALGLIALVVALILDQQA